MAKGMSLHIGLNHVNPNAYNGWDGALAGCINDANSMQSIAVSQGFQTQKLIDGQATSSQVVSKISEISEQLQSGDIFLLTYSGHGGQLPDQTGEEEDGMNETWVLYDRELLDNELYCLWSRFAAGVRIFVTSDSCHSGTVVRLLFKEQTKKRGKNYDILALQKASEEKLVRDKTVVSTAGDSKSFMRAMANPKPKFIPIDVSLRAFEKKLEEYRYYSSISGKKEQNPIVAHLIFISGCQDNQFSYDGDQNGLFTGNLLQVWANGGFSGSHVSFYTNISALMPSYQTPNYMVLGNPVQGYAEQKPFSIQIAGSVTDDNNGQGSAGGNQRPSATAPASWGINNEPPLFSINKGSNPYYYVEVSSDVQLFNYAQHGSERNSQNFYGTWADSQVSPRLTSSSFQLPITAWNNLKNSSKLFYKVGSTSSIDPASWDNHMVSFYEDELDQAPFIEIVTAGTPQPQEPSTDGSGKVISASVGRGGVNKREDVLVVQNLLNQVPADEGGPSVALVEDGLIGNKTINAIQNYQAYIGITQDGLISPNGPTFKALSASREGKKSKGAKKVAANTKKKEYAS